MIIVDRTMIECAKYRVMMWFPQNHHLPISKLFSLILFQSLVRNASIYFSFVAHEVRCICII